MIPNDAIFQRACIMYTFACKRSNNNVKVTQLEISMIRNIVFVLLHIYLLNKCLGVIASSYYATLDIVLFIFFQYQLNLGKTKYFALLNSTF